LQLVLATCRDQWQLSSGDEGDLMTSQAAGQRILPRYYESTALGCGSVAAPSATAAATQRQLLKLALRSFSD